jgi:hypothetical protein
MDVMYSRASQSDIAILQFAPASCAWHRSRLDGVRNGASGLLQSAAVRLLSVCAGAGRAFKSPSKQQRLRLRLDNTI